jgi:hypothetical protein
MLASLALLPLAHLSAGPGVFCLPTTGPLSLTLSGFHSQRNANFNGTGQIRQSLRRDFDLGVQRIDFEQVSLTPFGRTQGTHLVNYKENAQWTIDIDAAGKAVCTKEKQPPGPQPSGDDCFASSAVPLRRGTQGPLEVTWWSTGPSTMGNLTIVAAGTDTLAESMLHYGGLTAFVSFPFSNEWPGGGRSPPRRRRGKLCSITIV